MYTPSNRRDTTCRDGAIFVHWVQEGRTVLFSGERRYCVSIIDSQDKAGSNVTLMVVPRKVKHGTFQYCDVGLDCS